jgi:hypothetical protein
MNTNQQLAPVAPAVERGRTLADNDVSAPVRWAFWEALPWAVLVGIAVAVIAVLREAAPPQVLAQGWLALLVVGLGRFGWRVTTHIEDAKEAQREVRAGVDLNGDGVIGARPHSYVKNPPPTANQMELYAEAVIRAAYADPERRTDRETMKAAVKGLKDDTFGEIVTGLCKIPTLARWNGSNPRGGWRLVPPDVETAVRLAHDHVGWN